MLARIVFGLALTSLASAAYAGGGTQNPYALAPAPAASSGLSGNEDFPPAADTSSQSERTPALSGDVGSVHMSLHIMGAAGAGGSIRP